MSNGKDSGWISVETRLPESGSDVLVCCSHGSMYCAVLVLRDGSFECMQSGGVIYWEVTDWMPITGPSNA